MNLLEILTEAEKELEIDYNSDIGFIASKQPNLFIKYTKKLKEETLRLKSMYLQLEELESNLWIYYTGKAHPDVYKSNPLDTRFLKSESKMAIQSDKSYQQLKQKIIVQEELVDTLEKLVKQINDRHWTIKNIIEWKKFISGN